MLRKKLKRKLKLVLLAVEFSVLSQLQLLVMVMVVPRLLSRVVMVLQGMLQKAPLLESSQELALMLLI